jgi:hypothetical protein
MSKPPAEGADAPSLEYLMASVIRLMSVCTAEACEPQQRTLLHLLKYLLKHPGLERTPGAASAVRQAAEIWMARAGQRDAEGGQATRH